MPLRRYAPSELLSKFYRLRQEIEASEFFSKPQYQKLQEIWCAGHFGRGLELLPLDCAVWIADDDQQTAIDFELEASGRRQGFQVTEVQVPGRRRGDEYRGRSEGPWSDEDWTRGTEQGAQWIYNAIEKKAKQYGKSDDLNLLVYVNFPAWDMQFDAIRLTVAAQSECFASVWLLSGNALCCIKPSAQLPETNGWLQINESTTSEASQETPDN